VRAIFLGLGALALAATAQAKPLSKGARYVAMGSSYAAGTGIGGIKPGTPQRCGRSPKSYSSLVAERLKLDLVDASCGGATTAHILGPWSELPPQIEAVDKDTRLVTVTIGGNDLGYVMNLYGGSCTPEVAKAAGRTCPGLKPPSAQAYARVESNLRLIAQEVRKRAPRARLVFVQYVQIVPTAPCEALGLSPEGMLLNREIGERLAMITSRAAAAEGADVLQSQDLSRNHTLCDAQPWSVGLKPTGPDGPASWHPNAGGHAALADALVKLLRR